MKKNEENRKKRETNKTEKGDMKTTKKSKQYRVLIYKKRKGHKQRDIDNYNNIILEEKKLWSEKLMRSIFRKIENRKEQNFQ